MPIRKIDILFDYGPRVLDVRRALATVHQQDGDRHWGARGRTASESLLAALEAVRQDNGVGSGF